MPAQKNITADGDNPVIGYTGKLSSFYVGGVFDGATVKLQWRPAGFTTPYLDVGGNTDVTFTGLGPDANGDNFTVGGKDLNVNVSGSTGNTDISFAIEIIGSPL